MVELDLDVNGVDEVDGVNGVEIKLGWIKIVLSIFLVTVITELNCSACYAHIENI